jgi:hypothetical protein
MMDAITNGGTSEPEAASLIVVGNLPNKTRFTFANAIRGAKIRFGGAYDIRRVVVLETPEAVPATDERNLVIRSILESSCTIVSVPCPDPESFRVCAFKVIADELKRRETKNLVVDITNGRREQTFDLIIATSICRIRNVIITSVPQDCLATPYDQLSDQQYTITAVKPFSEDGHLESAAHFELIYYADRVKECVDVIRRCESPLIAGVADKIESDLTNSVLNYFSDEPSNLDNSLKRLCEVQELLADRLASATGSVKPGRHFADHVDTIRERLSRPARDAARTQDTVDSGLLAAAMLAELLDFCRVFRNYMDHPNVRRIERQDARLMIFTTFTVAEKAAAAASWCSHRPAS